MSKETSVGGASTWSHIQRLYDADPAIHWQRCESEGLEIAHEAFLQLFLSYLDFPVISFFFWGSLILSL